MARICVSLLACVLLIAPASASAAFGEAPARVPATLALTAPASAATLPQVPPREFSGDEQCVRATGAPGLLAVEEDNGVRFVHATRAGFTLGERVRLGEAFRCGTTTVRASGAG